jgi:hypothetical protein
VFTARYEPNLEIIYVKFLSEMVKQTEYSLLYKKLRTFISPERERGQQKCVISCITTNLES